MPESNESEDPREETEILREEVDILREELDELHERFAVLTDRVASLERDREVLLAALENQSELNEQYAEGEERLTRLVNEMAGKGEADDGEDEAKT